MIVIFDWDGTLCDSLDDIVAAMLAAAGEVGLEAPSAMAVREIIGLGLPQALERLFPGHSEMQQQAMSDAYARHFLAQTEAGPRLYAGAREVLDSLAHRGFELAVATGKSRRGLDRVLSALGMQGSFHITRCADETHSKPDPLMIHQILEQRGWRPEEAIVVGDSEYDLEMASNAEVASVGVSYGVHSVARLRRHAPVAVIDALPALLELPRLSA